MPKVKELTLPEGTHWIIVRDETTKKYALTGPTISWDDLKKDLWNEDGDNGELDGWDLTTIMPSSSLSDICFFLLGLCHLEGEDLAQGIRDFVAMLASPDGL